MSEKLLDTKGRWRNKVVAFRASPEEAEELDKRVKLCGYRSKQDFILDSVLHQRVVAEGNPLMLIKFRRELQSIENELIRIANVSEIDEELFTPIRTMLEILEAFAKGSEA